MGACCCSASSKSVIKKRYPKTIRLLHMKSNLGPFIKFFKKYDRDQSGSLSFLQFLDGCDLDRTPFTTRAFLGADDDGSGSLDFREFLFTVWNICTLDRDGLAVFTFQLYDEEGTGDIEKQLMPTIMEDLNGRHKAQTKANQHVLTKIEASFGPTVGLDDFVSFCKTHPAMLLPAFSLQRQLRRIFIGESFWEKFSKWRKNHKDQRYVYGNWRNLKHTIVELDAAQANRQT